MAINLSKGQRIDVGLQKAGIGLGWNPTASGKFDLDASAFILGANGKLISDDYFIFYNQTASPDGAVTHSGDNRDGEGDGDDETIFVNLTSIDSKADQIIFVVTIDEAAARKQNFGQVRNAFIRIYDQSNGQEICKYELDEDFSTESAVEFGRLYRKSGAWKFEAIGRGHNGGLEGLLNQYS